MGLGVNVRMYAVTMLVVLGVGCVLLAIVVALLVRWRRKSWRAAGYAFGIVLVLGAVFLWFESAGLRAYHRDLDRAYEITDPLWQAAGVEAVRSVNELERETCQDTEVTTVFAGTRMSDVDSGIERVGDRLRTEGWRTTELVTPKGDRPWVYAVNGADTVVVWPDEVLKMEVRLGDCYLLRLRPGTVEEPNCGRGGWVQCVRDGLRSR